MGSVGYSARWQDVFGPAADADDGRMTLASASPPGGTTPGAKGEAGNLKHSGGPWTSAALTSGDLRTSTDTSRTALGPGHEGMEAGAAGFTSVASLKSVLKSWEDRLTAVREECESLQGALAKVAKEMGETETAVKNSFAATQKTSDRR